MYYTEGRIISSNLIRAGKGVVGGRDVFLVAEVYLVCANYFTDKVRSWRRPYCHMFCVICLCVIYFISPQGSDCHSQHSVIKHLKIYKLPE